MTNKITPAGGETWHCEICGQPGETVKEHDFETMGDAYQLYAHPECANQHPVNVELDPEPLTPPGEAK